MARKRSNDSDVETLEPPPEGGTYLGFLLASGPSPEAVEASLRERVHDPHFRGSILVAAGLYSALFFARRETRLYNGMWT